MIIYRNYVTLVLRSIPPLKILLGIIFEPKYIFEHERFRSSVTRERQKGNIVRILSALLIIDRIVLCNYENDNVKFLNPNIYKYHIFIIKINFKFNFKKFICFDYSSFEISIIIYAIYLYHAFSHILQFEFRLITNHIEQVRERKFLPKKRRRIIYRIAYASRFESSFQTKNSNPRVLALKIRV